ncbi:SDHC isoform 8, partial [Pongo abelii]
HVSRHCLRAHFSPQLCIRKVSFCLPGWSVVV